MQEFSRESLRVLLAAFIEQHDLMTRRVAKAIGCSDATIIRLLAAKTLPSDEMMQEVALMVQAGFDRYARMTKPERRLLSKKMERSVVGGSVVGGFAAIPDVVGAFGKQGLSGPGIASGLKKMSGGNGMVGGIQAAAAIPILAGALGYVVIVGVNYFASERQLDVTDMNPRWEIINEAEGPKA